MPSTLAPDGRMWKIGREWAPRRVRLRAREGGEVDGGGDGGWIADALSGLADVSVSGVLIALAAVVAGVLLVTVVWPLVAIALELVILVVLFLAGLFGRIAVRRPWRIVARTKGPPADRLVWEVVGWRASQRAIAEVTSGLRSGRSPSSTDRLAS